MTIFIFTGPTLSAHEGSTELEAVFLPPAAQGDVYRATLENPRAIGIIDGYFERIPSVWHKEILWAMAQGIHVFGSASMGALRATELETFGMVGVGAIYEAFQRGELEDDDEVAVVHATAEDGFRWASEAMVNIRATLRAAEAKGVIESQTCTTLERIAKSLFYPERGYPLMLSRAAAQGLAPLQLDALRAWLPDGRINQKRADALAMLRHMRERLAEEPEPKRVRYAFEHTETWEEVRRRADRLPLGVERKAGALGASHEALLEELKLRGKLVNARYGAMARALALEQAFQLGKTVGTEALQVTADELRRDHGLFTPGDLERWLEHNRLTPQEFERFVRDEALVREVEAMLEPDVTRTLPDHLRATGEYGELLDRVRDKQQALASRGLTSPTLENAGVTEAELWRWYFEERLRRPVPAEIARYARGAGFSDEYALRQAVLRERLYPG